MRYKMRLRALLILLGVFVALAVISVPGHSTISVPEAIIVNYNTDTIILKNTGGEEITSKLSKQTGTYKNVTVKFE